MMQQRRHASLVPLGVIAATLLVGALPPPGFGRIAEAAAPREAPTAPAKWPRPRFAEYADERLRMVRTQIAARGVSQRAVLAALRHVPRHKFVPHAPTRVAYADRPLFIGKGQTISQPYIVAYMTEVLRLKPGQKVLEIGTGSGYQAAVLAEMTPHVFTVEIIRALGTQAKERLGALGYKTVKCRLGDGWFGWEEHAPFDAIIVTCASGSVPPPLVRQLRPGGRMCIPVGPPGHVQQLILVTKDAAGKVRSRSLMPVRFVPLTREAP